MRLWIFLSLLTICSGISKLSGKAVDSLSTNEIRISDLNSYKNIINYGTDIQMEIPGPFGIGLRNMKKRIESIGSTYQISRKKGTLTFLDIPL